MHARKFDLPAINIIPEFMSMYKIYTDNVVIEFTYEVEDVAWVDWVAKVERVVEVDFVESVLTSAGSTIRKLGSSPA